MIAGLYPYARGGAVHPPRVTLSEIPVSLCVNPTYRNNLLVLAGDSTSAQHLEGFGLRVARVFDDAPAEIRRDAAHKMKHWMCRWALREFGEFLWVDWDTVCVREPDDGFWEFARAHGTPKFIKIPRYWATVNCGVYFAPANWSEAMDRSFDAVVHQPNDELLWTSVLPPDVVGRSEFWWGDRIENIANRDDLALVGHGMYFAHVRSLEWGEEVRARSTRCAEEGSISADSR